MWWKAKNIYNSLRVVFKEYLLTLNMNKNLGAYYDTENSRFTQYFHIISGIIKCRKLFVTTVCKKHTYICFIHFLRKFKRVVFDRFPKRFSQTFAKIRQNDLLSNWKTSWMNFARKVKFIKITPHKAKGFRNLTFQEGMSWKPYLPKLWILHNGGDGVGPQLLLGQLRQWLW